MISFLIAVVSALAGLVTVYFLGRTHGRDAERVSYEGAHTAYVEHLSQVDAKAGAVAAKEIATHAQEAADALDLDSAVPFDEEAAKALVAGAGVKVKP